MDRPHCSKSVMYMVGHITYNETSLGNHKAASLYMGTCYHGHFKEDTLVIHTRSQNPISIKLTAYT